MVACLVKAPGEEIAARAIYARYLQWCAGAGGRKSLMS
jgi:hypothetical protein